MISLAADVADDNARRHRSAGELRRADRRAVERDGGLQ
jgi:hypothetical protein